MWDNVRKTKSWIRSFVVLYFLLGIGWIIGVCVQIPDDDNCIAIEILEYLHIVFNCSCGLWIFLYIVLCNTSVKNASKKLIRTSTAMTKTTRTTRNSPNQNLHRRNTTKRDTPIFIVNDESPLSTSSRGKLAKNAEN